MSLYVQRSAPRVGQTNCPLLLALSEAKVNHLQPRPPSASKNSFSSLVYCQIDDPASVLGRKFSARQYQEERLSFPLAYYPYLLSSKHTRRMITEYVITIVKIRNSAGEIPLCPLSVALTVSAQNTFCFTTILGATSCINVPE